MGAIALSVVAVLAACSSSGSEGSAEPTVAPVAVREDAAPAELATRNPAFEPVLEGTGIRAMPIDEFFGSPTVGDALIEEFVLLLREREQHTTECIRANGFEFFTQPPDERRPQNPLYGPRTDRVAVELYGVTSALMRTARSLQDQTVESATSIVRNNRAGIAALTGGELEAFNEAFFSCSDEAFLLFPEETSDQSAVDEVSIEVAEARQAMSGHPDFRRLWAEWADCMRESGFDNFNQRVEIGSFLRPEADAIMADLRANTQEVSSGTLDRIDRLRERERAIADADIRCSESIDLDARFVQVQFELETEILRAKGDRWTLIRASAQGD